MSARVVLPAPFGPVTAVSRPPSIATSPTTAAGRPRPTTSASVRISAGARRRPGRGPAGSRPGTQTPAAASSAPRSRRGPARGGPSATTPSGPSTITRSTWSCQVGDAVLDDHERRSGGGRRAHDRVPHLDDPGRIEVRGRLVEQHEPRPHGEHAREGEPLLLPARERTRRARAAGPRGPTSASAAGTRRWISSTGTPRFSAPNATSSPTRGRITCDSGSCSTKPARPAAGLRPSMASSPAASPWSSPSTPASAASSVDFPLPEAPSSSTRSPGSIVRSSPLTAQASRPPCRQPQPRASMRAAVTPRAVRRGRSRTGRARRWRRSP